MDNDQTAPDGLTPGAVAARLGVPVTDVRRWMRTEQCPVVRDGRKTRIPRAWVDEQLSRVQHVQHPVVVRSTPEPEPVNLDNPLEYAAALRAQAARLIAQAAAIEHTANATSTGADGRTRPTWDRFNNDRTEQQVRELRQAGQSVRDIADTLGCSRGTAHRIIRKLGIYPAPG